MLTKDCEQILDFLIPLFKDQHAGSISFSKIQENLKMPFAELIAAIAFLSDENYIQTETYIDGGGVIKKLTHKGFHYKEFVAVNSASSATTNIFNAPVNNSAISNTGTVTVNNGISLAELREFVNSHTLSEEDRIAISKLVDYLETISENDSPIKKGVLSKFSDLLAKHSWLPSLVGQFLYRYTTGG